MKKIVLLIFAIQILFSSCSSKNIEKKLKNGDIIFQTSKSQQSKAIQAATKSRYSHMGIIYKNNGKYYVCEAVQPVKLTPLKEWISRGEKNHYIVKRLKEDLSENSIQKMKKIGEQFLDKDYDLYFEWSDDKIYCSELVWKIYKRALNIEIGNLKKLKDFDLENTEVKRMLLQRYGEKIPLEETVISPSSMFNSEKLKTIIEN